MGPAIALVVGAGLAGFFVLRAVIGPPEGSAPKAGPPPAAHDSGAPADPSLPALPGVPAEGPAEDCEACRARRCIGNSLLAACDPLPGDVQQGRAAGKPKREACAAAVACMRSAGCYSDQGDPRACYCGTAETGACLAGKGNGPCRAALEDAAETTDPEKIASRWTETSFAIAQAVHEVGCRTGMCRRSCLASFAHP